MIDTKKRCEYGEGKVIMCSCGIKFVYTTSEGQNPGCKEREYVICPKCKKYFGTTSMLNDGRVSTTIVT